MLLLDDQRSFYSISSKRISQLFSFHCLNPNSCSFSCERVCVCWFLIVGNRKRYVERNVDEVMAFDENKDGSLTLDEFVTCEIAMHSELPLYTNGDINTYLTVSVSLRYISLCVVCLYLCLCLFS